MDCVYWYKYTTTKCLRHITILEHNFIESVKDKVENIMYIEGDIKSSGIFTKEHKYVQHFTILINQLATSKITANEIIVT